MALTKKIWICHSSRVKNPVIAKLNKPSDCGAVLLCDNSASLSAGRLYQIKNWLFGSAFFVRIAVELMVDVAEAFVGYVCVNLRCGDVAVAKKFLDAAQVNSLV